MLLELELLYLINRFNSFIWVKVRWNEYFNILLMIFNISMCVVKCLILNLDIFKNFF